MQQLRRNRVCRFISFVLIMALFAPQGLVFKAAQAQTPGLKVPVVAVLPFQDRTGSVSGALMREATAAAALALEDTREFVVIATADLDTEMAALRLKPPLSQPEQIRLGQRLHADKVLEGSLESLSIDSKTGRARATLSLRMLDVGVEEYLDGAITTIETKAVPGFAGDVAAVMHEALRQVAEAAVAQMLSSAVRHGTVELVDDQGNININLGTDDGLTQGSEMLVLRPTWQPDIEKVVMRRVGVIRVMDVGAKMAVARKVEGAMPTTGDRIYRIYKPVAVQMAELRGRKISSGVKTLAGMLLLLGLVGFAQGPTTESASTLSGGLAQSRPGADPVVRLTVKTGQSALDKTHGWLIFRAANNPNFPAIAAYLIDAISGRKLPEDTYTDDPFDFRVVEDFEITFQYLEQDDLQDATVTVNYNDFPMTRGTRYFYRVRRCIEPLTRPGENPPLATGQIRTRQQQQPQPTEPSIETDPDDRVLSTPSNAVGPITFFTPPTLSAPANGAQSVPTDAVTFTWQPTLGANEYQVELFPADDPDGLRAPILQSVIVRDTGAAVLTATIRNLQPGTTYWWRVGARQSGDPVRPLNMMTGVKKFLYSEMRTFTTVIGPPPIPTGATSPRSSITLPGRHGGWWGSDRRSR